VAANRTQEREVHLACGVAHRLNDECPVPPDSFADLLRRAVASSLSDREQALDRITAIDQLRRELDDQEKMAVIGARMARRTWAELGAAVGTSRQAAYNRWGEMVKRYEAAGLLDDVDTSGDDDA